MSPEFSAIHASASTSLIQGDDRNAFMQLRPAFAYPGKLAETDWAPALLLFSKIVRRHAGEPAVHAEQAAANPVNVRLLYDFGYQCIEERLPEIAATVLARANQLQPGNAQVIAEFCSALEALDLHAEALRTLQSAPSTVESDPTLQYLMGFHSLMVGNREQSRHWITRAAPAVPDPLKPAISQVTQMLQRADSIQAVCALDDKDLRGWQFVTCGTILLHLSPFGFAEGMNGRYAFFQDDVTNCRHGIMRLYAVLDCLKAMPQCVHILPDRDSAALGLATAKLLGCPASPWPDGGSDKPGLIVAYDLSSLKEDVVVTLRYRPNQPLWSHATCWTAESPFAPDFATFLYQVNKSPWAAGRLRINPDTKQMEHSPATPGTAEELAATIVSAPDPDNVVDDLDALCKLAMAAFSDTGPSAAGAFRSSGYRRRQRLSSPVHSNRFH